MSQMEISHLNKWIITFLSLLIMPLAHAGAATDRLQTFYNDVKSLRASFGQTVTDANGKLMQRASGTMALQRPGRFRWDYEQPHDQLIVADGNKVWLYDPELEQVTVKSQGEALGDTPAQLLSSGKPLEQSFRVSELPARDGIEWVELTPKSKDTGFDRVRLGFDAKSLAKMELVDAFGQTTRLTFTGVERNPRLDANLFKFIPPKGVDVVGE